MSRVYNQRTRRFEENGIAALPPAPGTTVAKDASPLSGLASGAVTSTAAANLAARPTVFQPAQHAQDVLAPTLQSQGARPVAGPPAPPVAPTVAQFRAAPVGKVGAAYNPAAPEGPLTPGTTIATPGGGTVKVGTNKSGGESGIFVNGKSVTHDDNGQLVDAPTTRAPLSYADQKAAILEAYPQVGVAGSAQNKQYVDAFTKGGQNQETALDLAHSLFAPKTQAGTIAATKVQDQATDAKATAQIVADKAATRAARTPQEVAADDAKAASNQAKVAAAGQQVLDQNPVAKQVGQVLTDAPNNGVISDAVSNAAGLFGGTGVSGAGNIGTAIPKIASGVSNFFGGFGTDTSTPPAPSVMTMPNPGAANLPTRPRVDTDPLAPTASSPATTPILPPVPNPVPAVPDPTDPDELKRKRIAASSPGYMQ